MKIIPSACLAISLLAAWPSPAQQRPLVRSFSPQGTVKRVRQVRAQFSDPMVAFGDPRPALTPFEISCSPRGTGRWVDTNNWSYDFDQDLPAGVRCEFRLKDGLKTLVGVEVAGQAVFAFSTGGPAILNSRPWEGSGGIDESQVFILNLDADARPMPLLLIRNFDCSFG